MKKRHRFLLLSLVIGLIMMACKTISEPIVNIYSSSTQDVEQSQSRTHSTGNEDTNSTPTRQVIKEDETSEEGNSPDSFPDGIITASPTIGNSLENENEIDPYPGPGEATTNQNNATPTLTHTPDLQNTPQTTGTPQGSITPDLQNTLQTTTTPQGSVTPIPTNTNIPIELPAWIASEIEASDPASVELSSGSYQFIEFFAYWCGTCLALAPEIHTLQTHYGEEVNFIYLDIDDPANDIFKQQLHYQHQPQFYLLDREGNVVRQWLGTVTFEELVSAFESILNSQ